MKKLVSHRCLAKKTIAKLEKEIVKHKKTIDSLERKNAKTDKKLSKMEKKYVELLNKGSF